MSDNYIDRIKSTTATEIRNTFTHPGEDTTNTTPATAVDLNQLHQLNTEAMKSRQSIWNLKREVAEYKKDISNIEDKVKDSIEKIESSKNDQIQLLAIFVGLFTFISIEFQLFKQTESSYILPLSLSMGGVLIAFLATIILVIKSNANKMMIAAIIVVSLLVSICGILLYLNARSEIEKSTRSDVSNICKDLKAKIAEHAIDDNAEEIKKLKVSHETLLCEQSNP